jgi:hypothetical protein
LDEVINFGVEVIPVQREQKKEPWRILCFVACVVLTLTPILAAVFLSSDKIVGQCFGKGFPPYTENEEGALYWQAIEEGKAMIVAASSQSQQSF